jgi:hypothetical protein
MLSRYTVFPFVNLPQVHYNHQLEVQLHLDGTSSIFGARFDDNFFEAVDTLFNETRSNTPSDTPTQPRPATPIQTRPETSGDGSKQQSLRATAEDADDDDDYHII